MVGATPAKQFTRNTASASLFVKIVITKKWRDMKKIKIAFDIDGTIRSNIEPYEHDDTSLVKWNYRICELAMTLASMKNTKLILWSGSGKQYAEHIRQLFHAHFSPNKKVFKSAHSKTEASRLDIDIAIDDIQACELGELNLIVREK